MKTRYIIKLPLILLFLASVVFLISCKEDEDNGSGNVELLSFGPSGVKHGERIKFIGSNLDKVTSIKLPMVEVNRSSFTTQTSELIELVVPEEAQAGKVFLITPAGEIETKTMLNFLVPVEISSITTEARPGTNITIKGKLVSWIEEVVFDDELSVTEFVSQSLDEVVVTVPMGAKTGFLIFKTGGTAPLSFASPEKLIVSIPTISSLSPLAIKHTEELTITGTNLDLVKTVILPGDTIKEFVSQSENEIVVVVSSKVVKGKITLTQESPVDVVSEDELTIILPVGVSLAPSPAVPGTSIVTITGTDLDLVGELILPGSGSLNTFTSKTATEIVFPLPDGAKQGLINYVTIHGFEAPLGLVLSLPSAGPPPLLIPVFLDATSSALGEGGGWNTTTVFGSTERAMEGSKSIKVTFTSAGGAGAQFGTWGKEDLNLSGTNVFTFSVYGAPGTGGKILRAGLNSTGAWIWKDVTVEEGKWTDFEIPLSEYNFTAVREIAFDNNNGALDGIIYLDRVGFSTASAPKQLGTAVYKDAVESVVGTGGGWNSTSDFSNAEQTREGSKSIKVTYTSAGGAGAQLGTWGKEDLSLSGSTVFAFSVYGGPGTGGKVLRAGLNSTGNWVWKDVTLAEGKWTDFEIPLSEYGFPFVREIAFDNNNGGLDGQIYIDYIGFR